MAAQTLHLLARIAISTEPTVAVERDPGEGLGLVIAIGTSPAASPCTALERVADPTLTAIGVYTMQLPARHALLAVDARSETAFLDAWAALAGAGGNVARARRRRDQALAAAVAP